MSLLFTLIRLFNKKFRFYNVTINFLSAKIYIFFYEHTIYIWTNLL